MSSDSYSVWALESHLHTDRQIESWVKIYDRIAHRSDFSSFISVYIIAVWTSKEFFNHYSLTADNKFLKPLANRLLQQQRIMFKENYKIILFGSFDRLDPAIQKRFRPRTTLATFSTGRAFCLSISWIEARLLKGKRPSNKISRRKQRKVQYKLRSRLHICRSEQTDQKLP